MRVADQDPSGAQKGAPRVSFQNLVGHDHQRLRDDCSHVRARALPLDVLQNLDPPFQRRLLPPYQVPHPYQIQHRQGTRHPSSSPLLLTPKHGPPALPSLR